MDANIVIDKDSENVYVTDVETVCGSWNGKPLYRQVFDFGRLVNNTFVSRYMPVPFNCAYLKNAWGIIYGGLGFPCQTQSDMWWTDGTGVTFTTTADRSNYSAYFVFEYTKS